ncbi:MAG: aldehyde ferredoxin oxidoreductase N-terminal domain-containing protein [Candidatus Helarchaeota archaeon]
MRKFGFSGKIAYINLTSQEIKIFSIPKSYIPKFLGGYGINNRLFWDYQRPKTDPLAAENTMVLGAGPLVGTIFPGTGKVIGTTLSPIISSYKGLHIVDNAVVGTRRFGSMLKNAGFDHIVITGRAHKPSYLRISDDKVEVNSAEDLWGIKDIYETTDYFLQENPLMGVIAIGKGGENRIRYALALADYSGHLGKFGFGAVMGSKNLKAVVTYGTKGVQVAHPPEFLKLARKFRKKVQAVPLLKNFQDLGITSGWDLQAPLVYEGNIPYRTWKKKFGPKIWKKHKFRHNLACNGCVLACRTDYKVEEGSYKNTVSFTGHHFLPARVALRLGLEDPAESIKLLDICNRAGICFFTVGGLLNWLTRNEPELFPRKIAVYLNLLEKIITRKEIGEVLANGWYPLSEKLERDPDAFIEGTGFFRGADAIQDGRTTTLDPQRFTYITSPRSHHGGTQSIYTLPKMALKILQTDAMHLGISPEEYDRIFTPTPYYGQFNVGRYSKHAEDAMAVHNSLGTCIVYTLFGTEFIHIDLLAQLYSAVTGISMTPHELKLCGERIFTLYKLLNIREGWNFRDKVSKIWLTPRQTPDGPKKLMDYHQVHELSADDIEKLLNDYYAERGFNLTGIPSKKKLAELGLLDFADLSSQ